MSADRPSPVPTPGLPLCVDLDGTLVRSDLLIESLFALLKRNLFYLLLLPWWLLGGKARFKAEIAARVELEPGLLPYREDLLAYLRQQRAAGRRLVLATASHIRSAEAVALHLGLFDGVLASDARRNLSGTLKLARLEQEFGPRGFAYAGDSRVDLPIWARAGAMVLVAVPPRLQGAAERLGTPVERVFQAPSGQGPALYAQALRINQWVKNLLLFVPLAMAHRLQEPALLGQALLAFVSFCLCASSVYLLNDLLDLPADRRHPSKRRRPFASGALAPARGLLLIPLLLLLSFALALALPWAFAAFLGLYYLGTLAYSLWLKGGALIDVLTLAGLYTLRILAGAAAVAVTPSFWLLAFSMFLFLSLALVKRYIEIATLAQPGQAPGFGRGYRAEDLPLLSQFGTTSGYLAVLVLALYINGDNVQALYSHPELIWLLCPLLLYLISRTWLLAARGELHEDPVVFALRDRRSQWLGALGVALLWLAT